jgi:endoglucanase
MIITEESIELIRSIGFDAVRIPIRWNAHAADLPLYSIKPAFFDRVDKVIGWAKERDLIVMINLHHYNELMEEPEQHHERFLSIWRQIAEHYQNYPSTLLFEVLNEPHDNLGPDLWNDYLRDAIDVIRDSSPHRTLVIGTAPWGGFGGLKDLSIPEEERNIIVTVHYYNPFQFTHQGASWAGNQSEGWLGTTWDGTVEEMADVDADFDGVLEWARQHDAEERAHHSRREDGHGQVVALRDGERPGRVGADHVDRPVREVEHSHGSQEQGQSRSHQEQDRAQRHAVGEDLHDQCPMLS